MPSNSLATFAPCSPTCAAANSKAAGQPSVAPRNVSNTQRGQANRRCGIDANLRDLIADEPDFNPLRHDPDFIALTGAMA